ncbi:hypothetical protein [Enterococcus sp. AZ007]|uniref:hypothetical protein n=1 Tax=Enterococcus sp. AZ007 TaxID=2774839 RepID=UPI003F694D09
MTTWKGCVISLFYDDIRPQYYLRRWKYYGAAREVLNPHELENAKILFNSLRQLTHSDLELLSDVYFKDAKPSNWRKGYHLSVVPAKDTVLAPRYGVSVEQFRSMRIQAQDNLKEIMQEMLKRIRANFIYRINRSLYLVDIVERGTRKEKYVLGEECDAKKFGSSDSDQEASHLKSLGFERVPVNEERQ